MTTTEIAIKYGVPMPETCKELNWQGNTLFAWVFDEINNKYIIVDFKGWLLLGGGVYYPAPQMHEIAPLLPTQIMDRKLILEHCEGGDLFYSTDNLIEGMSINATIGALYANVSNNHYAQAYAELYIKLKQGGLLSTL